MINVEPILKVGIVTGSRVEVNFVTTYRRDDGATVGGRVTFEADRCDRDAVFVPIDDDGCFELAGVTIGVDFHWQRRETQRFCGSLIIMRRGDEVTAVNAIGVEPYLRSVVSSEMSANAAPELLKAHAVISRSWVVSQLLACRDVGEHHVIDDRCDNADERIMWYDRSQHDLFDVCADDHCQRYQGMTRQSNHAAEAAVESTRGEILLSGEGDICDARFSKCCGGVFERFESCWAPQHHSYLIARRDYESEEDFPDLTIERNAEEWILKAPPSYCNVNDLPALDRALNAYDRETPDFYRWEVSYTADELSDIVCRRSGIDFGRIVDLRPLERGTSGRVYRLEIVGTLRSLVIGKELEIRRTLSKSHLKSSAFVVRRHAPDADGLPSGFTLHGAGWGHGVGLCQIGAAMMAEMGHGYRDILKHYYAGASVERIYD